jgi:hypothetical protein
MLCELCDEGNEGTEGIFLRAFIRISSSNSSRASGGISLASLASLQGGTSARERALEKSLLALPGGTTESERIGWIGGSLPATHPSAIVLGHASPDQAAPIKLVRCPDAHRVGRREAGPAGVANPIPGSSSRSPHERRRGHRRRCQPSYWHDPLTHMRACVKKEIFSFEKTLGGQQKVCNQSKRGPALHMKIATWRFCLAGERYAASIAS